MLQNFILNYHSVSYIIFVFHVRQGLEISSIQSNFIHSLASWVVNIVFQDIALSR